MKAELKKELQEIVGSNIRNKADLAEVISTMLDEYTNQTGNAYIALLYPLGAFNNSGQFRKKEQTIPPTVAASIAEVAHNRAELALTYRINAEQEAMRRGYIICA